MIRSKGFTLVEALVALLVLSFGLLGVAAMQLKALQSAHIGSQRSMASLIAIDGQERVWRHFALDSSECPEESEIDFISDEWYLQWREQLSFIVRNNEAELNTRLERLGDCMYNVAVEWQESRGVTRRPLPVPEEEVPDAGEEPEESLFEETVLGYGFKLPQVHNPGAE